jgi:hypothetical protein
LKLFEEAIGCVKYFMAMFDEFEDYGKTIGTIRNGFESCEDKLLKEEVSMLMKKLHTIHIERRKLSSASPNCAKCIHYTSK